MPTYRHKGRGTVITTTADPGPGWELADSPPAPAEKAPEAPKAPAKKAPAKKTAATRKAAGTTSTSKE